MSLVRKILWNTFSQVIGKFLIAIIGVITINLLTDYLGLTGYGEYTAAYDFLAFFGIVADLGLYTIGVREMAKDEKKIPMIVGNILTIRTIVAVLIIGLGAVAAFVIPKYDDTRIPWAVVLAGVAMVFNILTSTVSTILQVHLKMQYNSFASVMGKVVNVGYMAAIIFFVFPENKVDGFYQLMWAGIAGNFVMLAITYYYSSKLTNIKYRFDAEFFKDVIIKALPYGIALVLNTIYFRIGSVLLSLLRPGVDEVGLYGPPMRILEAVGIIPLYFMNSVLPVLSQSISKKDGRHQSIIQYSFDFLMMGSMPLVAGTVVLAYPIISIISNDEFLSNLSIGFYGSDIVLQILIFALAFSFVNSLFGFILVAANQQMKILTRNSVGALMTIILDLIFIPYYGVRAAAFTNVITECYVAIASYVIAKRFLDFKINLTNTFKTLISAIVMGLGVYWLKVPLANIFQNKSVFFLIPIGGIIYVAMLFLTKAVTKDMLKMLKRSPVPASTTKAEAVGGSVESAETPQQ